MNTNELTTRNTNDTAQTTGTEVSSSEPMISKEDVEKYTNEQLSKWFNETKGHTNDFSEYFHCDFSYTYFTNLLKKRGLKHSWRNVNNEVSQTDTPDIITLNKSEYSTIRKSYTVSSSTADEWRNFCKNVPNPSILLSAAMERFMADYRAGKIKFEIGIDI